MSPSCLRFASFVGLHRSLRGFDLGFRAGQLGFDLVHMLGKGGDFGAQGSNARVDLLQVDQFFKVRIHQDRWEPA